MDSLSIGIQVSGYFWILEKSTKFTKISQKNDSLSISIQISMDTWTFGYISNYLVHIMILGYLDASISQLFWIVG